MYLIHFVMTVVVGTGTMHLNIEGLVPKRNGGGGVEGPSNLLPTSFLMLNLWGFFQLTFCLHLFRPAKRIDTGCQTAVFLKFEKYCFRHVTTSKIRKCTC